MSTFMKAAVVVVITVIFTLVLPKNAKEFQVILPLAACGLLLVVACGFLQPVMDTIENIVTLGKIDRDILRILLKATGIALLAEYVVLICQDTGNTAVGKTLQTVASAVILWLSLPLINSLVELMENILSVV